MGQSVEGKLVARVRNVLIGDTGVKAIVGDRVYDAHISTIYQPQYPAVSLHVVDSAPMPYLVPGAEVALQLSIWVKEEQTEGGGVKDDLYQIEQEVRRALHLMPGGYDSLTALTLLEFREQGGAILFEQDTNVWHWARRYRARAV